MFEHRPHRFAFHGFMVAACLTLLAGCGENVFDTSVKQTDATPAASTPVTLVAAPLAPIGVSVDSGKAQAGLNGAARRGARTYRIGRSTVGGGPYSQIGAPTSAVYIDSSLIKGAAYYYVVSTINSAGESANAPQVSATPMTPVPNPPPTTLGTWTNVTPSGVVLSTALSCGNYGTQSVQVDPKHPSDIYTLFMCQGVWRSTDFGATWTGSINTGTNGRIVADCAGGITISPTSTASVPTIYASCIRGDGTGFWKSVDGGVNWRRYSIAPTPGRQDYYAPVVDPYDQNHLLMAGHEMDALVESTDGGQTWKNVSIAGGMHEVGGTGAIFFINTGNAATTRGTWLWMAQESGGLYGTWRTENSGAMWNRVDKNEHSHGASQLFQPDSSGVIFVAGSYSDHGTGVLRSTDYGLTWSHLGGGNKETVVVGTSKNVYAMSGGPLGIGGVEDPVFEMAARPGTGTWVMPGTPAALTQGPGQIAVVNDGTHNILVGAMWNAGVWRYIEP